MHYLISLGLTLLLEGGLALCWGIRGRDLALVALVNILTNPAAVLIHTVAPGIWLNTVLPELGAVTLEAFLYCRLDNRIRRPILFALCANGFSYFTGLLLGALI